MTDSFSTEQQQLVLHIGLMLLMCQALECPLDMFCELASASVVTLDLLEGLDAEDRRKTVGQMLNTLRKSMDVDPQIDSILQSFLDHRNEFVHRLESETRDLTTPKGRKEMAAFLSAFIEELTWLLNALPDLLLAWSRSVDMEDVFNRTFGALPKSFIEEIDQFEFSPKSEE